MAIELAALRKVDLFASLLPEHLKLIAGIVHEVEHKPSDKLFGDGDPADRFYFIVAGKVRISKQIPGVGEEALAVLEPGDYFGEMALIDEAPRSADAICNTTVTLGVIEKTAFEDLLFMNKDLAYDMLWTFVRTLSTRLRESNEKMRAFLTMAGSF
jgi:CRP/FNR family transcriptional regulator, cyclic AMP receptor protein